MAADYATKWRQTLPGGARRYQVAPDATRWHQTLLMAPYATNGRYTLDGATCHQVAHGHTLSDGASRYQVAPHATWSRIMTLDVATCQQVAPHSTR